MMAVAAPQITYRALRVWQRNLDVYRRLWISQLPFILIEPAFQMGAMGLGLGAFVDLGGALSYRDFLAPGLIASYAMFAAALECSWGAFSRMELQKTYDGILATPLSVDDVVVGELLWGASRSIIGMTAVFIVLAAFGVPMSPWAILIPPAMVVQGLMFGAISLLWITFVQTVNQMEHFFVLFLTPMFLFGGVFYPITTLPAWVQTVSWFFPLFHGANVSRALFLGKPHAGLIGDVLWMIVVGLIFSWLAILRMRRRLIQ
ncbi:MAG: ABC transporter permease [Chloroflexi bacterium]|nr:ABC transporter permease [Chloroflexota bacterium]